MANISKQTLAKKGISVQGGKVVVKKPSSTSGSSSGGGSVKTTFAGSNLEKALGGTTSTTLSRALASGGTSGGGGNIRTTFEGSNLQQALRQTETPTERTQREARETFDLGGGISRERTGFEGSNLQEALDRETRERIATGQFQVRAGQGVLGQAIGTQIASFRNTQVGGLVANALDTLTVAFSHPFKTIGAIVSPDEKVSGLIKEEFAKPLALQVGNTLIATASYATAIVSLGALITRLGTQGTAIATGNVLNGAGGTTSAGQVLIGAGKAGFVRGAGTITKLSTGQLIGRTGGFAVNSKNVALTGSYLTKLVSGLKNPLLHLGLISTVAYTSLFWGPNEKGDALTLLTIAQRDAVEVGDVDMVKKIDDLIQETNDIVAGIPVIGFIQAEIAKFKSASIASEQNKRAVEELIRDKAGIGQFESPFELSRRIGQEQVESNRAEAQAQFESNQQAILNAQLDAERRFAEAQQERDRTKQEQAREDTLFFEALRKRNAGETLTDAEIEILRQRGISGTISSQEDDGFGRSNLSFGLL